MHGKIMKERELLELKNNTKGNLTIMKVNLISFYVFLYYLGFSFCDQVFEVNIYFFNLSISHIYLSIYTTL